MREKEEVEPRVFCCIMHLCLVNTDCCGTFNKSTETAPLTEVAEVDFAWRNEVH